MSHRLVLQGTSTWWDDGTINCQLAIDKEPTTVSETYQLRSIPENLFSLQLFLFFSSLLFSSMSS